MDTVHREILDIHHHHLVSSLRANDVIDRLLKENAINKYDYDQLKRTEAQGARAMNRLLILTLRRRGGDAYPALQRSLLDSDQKDLHDLLKHSELDLLEGLLTERLQQAAEDTRSPRLPPPSVRDRDTDHFHDLPDLDLDFNPAAESPVPVLQKASSPALKNLHSPRRPRDRRKSRGRSPLRDQGHGSSPPPSPPSKEQQEEEEEEKGRQLKRLEKEVEELRKSHGKMETELRQQIEQLERKGEEEKGGKKKDGGCAVM